MAAVVLLAGGMARAAGDGNRDEARQRLLQVEQSMGSADARQRKLQDRVAAIESRLEITTRDMVTLAAAIQSREDRLSGLERAIARLDALRGEQIQRLDLQRRELLDLLAALQAMARRPAQLLMLKPGDAVDTARSAALLNTVLPEVQRRTHRLRAELAAITRVRTRLERDQARYRDELGRMKRDQALMQTLVDRRRLQRDGLIGQAASETDEARALADQARDIRDLIGRLEVEAARRDRLASLRGPRPRPHDLDPVAPQTPLQQSVPREPVGLPGPRPLPAEDVALAPVTGTPPPSEAAPPSSEPALSVALAPPPAAIPSPGQFLLPARGSLAQRYGQPTDAGGSAKGVTIQTRTDAQVIAPYGGRIIYGGRFRGYGQLLIIAHGGGYHSLLAGLDRIDVRVGDAVEAGEPVGQMGTPRPGPDGGMAPLLLYLELRQRGAPVDPMPLLQAGVMKSQG